MNKLVLLGLLFFGFTAEATIEQRYEQLIRQKESIKAMSQSHYAPGQTLSEVLESWNVTAEEMATKNVVFSAEQDTIKAGNNLSFSCVSGVGRHDDCTLVVLDSDADGLSESSLIFEFKFVPSERVFENTMMVDMAG